MRVIDRDGLVEKGIKYSRAQLDRKVKDGSFPKPIALGAARKGWIEEEIDTWLRARVAERDAIEAA